MSVVWGIVAEERCCVLCVSKESGGCCLCVTRGTVDVVVSLVRASALEADGFERAGVCAELPRRLLRQLGRVESRRRVAPHRAEAGVRGRRREGVLALCRIPADARLGEAKVVRGGQVKLCARRCCRWPGQGPVERGAAQRRGARARAGC